VYNASTIQPDVLALPNGFRHTVGFCLFAHYRDATGLFPQLSKTGDVIRMGIDGSH
jgi:hypothetical protein